MSDVYRFGPFAVDPQRRGLMRDGAPIPITSKAFDILLYFVRHPHRIVSKQDLLKAVWPDAIVEEGNLTQNISLLRKALGEAGNDEQLIVTVPRQGYQFTADVTVDARPRSKPRQRTLATAGLVLTAAIVASIAWRRLRVASDRAEKVRLAVLPFENLTGDTAQNYLADGLTEETITQLARLRPEQLGVIARTSVMSYKHGVRRMDEVGRDLNVSYALESNLRRDADRLRVTVQLIRVRDTSHLWAGDFDYAQHDVLDIEDSVATAITHAVRLQLTPEERARLARVRSSNKGTMKAIMLGRDLLYAPGKTNWETGKAYLDNAVAIDSTSALAWTLLSTACRRGADRGWMPADSGYRAARFAASRALQLDPNLPDAWEALGQFQRLVDWDWEGARRSYQRALDLDPGNVQAMGLMETSLDDLGRFDEAMAIERRIVELNPGDPDAIGSLAYIYADAGRPDEAAKLLEAMPLPFRLVNANELIQIYLEQGRVADAAAILDQEPDHDYQVYNRALVLFREGPPAAADSALATFIARFHANAAFQVAEVYAYRNEADSAFAWLDRAYAQRDQGLGRTKVAPLLKNIRSDPRYAAFLTKMRLAH